MVRFVFQFEDKYLTNFVGTGGASLVTRFMNSLSGLVRAHGRGVWREYAKLDSI